MRGFNQRLAAALEECRDVSAVEKLLDPDPLRYMWVDEGAGRLGEFLDRAGEALAAAGKLPGHTRVHGQPLPAAAAAARPCVAVSPRGDLVSAWVEWHKDRGEQVMAAVRDAGGRSAEAVNLSGVPGRLLPAHRRVRPGGTGLGVLLPGGTGGGGGVGVPA